MYRVENITQAYSQAPWRKQLQWIGLFMLALVMVAMVAGIYLSVSAQASSAGREIQIMYGEMDEMRRNIESMESQIAYLVANAEMEKRAEKLNFTPIAAEEIFYILVPGYSKPGQVTLANPSGNARPAAPTISPEYTQSLMDWIRERVFDPGSPLVQEVDRE
jgi:cell division protein FtsL